MVGMEFRDCDNDSIIPIDETLLKSLSTLDQQRLTKAYSYSSPFTHAPDPMEDEESDEKKQEAQRREVVRHSKHLLVCFPSLEKFAFS